MQATKSPFINAIFDREPLDQFVWGRVALLGEAAHPTTPHGLRRCPTPPLSPPPSPAPPTHTYTFIHPDPPLCITTVALPCASLLLPLPLFLLRIWLHSLTGTRTAGHCLTTA